MSCKGLHCNGCGHGGGGGIVLAVVVVLAVIAASIASAVESAARTAVHVLAVVLEVVFIGVAVLAAAAVAVALGWAGVRLYRWRSARRVLAAPAVIQARAEVVSPEVPAIESGRGRCPLCGEKTSDGKCKCPGFSADPVLVPTAKGR